jgi:hypothetical protein
MNSLDDVHDVADLNFYTRKCENNVEFAFAFHTDPETLVQTRFLCNSEELFLFEESFQRAKEEKRIEKIRKEEEMRRKFEEERLEKIRKDEEMKRKFEEEKRKMEMDRTRQYRTTSNEDWVIRTTRAFRPDDPSVIEIQAMFAAASQSILPFQNHNLPVPRVNPTDYRDPLPHYNEEDEVSDSY